jgi:hypothetical protein
MNNSLISLTCSSLSPSLKIFRYLSKSEASSCDSLKTPNLRINTFYATVRVIVQRTTFLATRLLCRGATVATCLGFQRCTGESKTRVGNDLAITFANDVGLVGMTSSCIEVGETPLVMLTKATPASTVGVTVGTIVVDGSGDGGLCSGK